jgi:hypothetical protein
VLSAATRVTSTSSAPDPLIDPANTRCSASICPASTAAGSGCARLSTGTLSPVIGAWSTQLSPRATTPSAGNRVFGLIINRSPTASSVTAIVSSAPSFSRVAVAGTRSTSPEIALRARAIANPSSE